ncbi:hypothetical protein SLS53_008396 [Cytospora paraplurivora]|uniref:Uncharacterized protein n=1 Tax=Cytospora paraplurivora TaxID=2898453 RepID=A0AAN9YCR8_9PEZI
MDAGKGAARKKWKDQLAELDRECGWDTTEGNLDWDEEVDKDKDKGDVAKGRGLGAHKGKTLGARRRKSRTAVAEGREVLFYNNKHNREDESAIVSEDDEEYFSAVEEMGEEPIMRRFSSRSRQEEDGDDTAACQTTSHQGQNRRGEDFEIRPGLMAYLEHRFGPQFDYEDRCFCHEWLVDQREQRIRTERNYYAHAGTVLLKEGCVLRAYPEDEVPGTEDVDKPMVTVTTPDGEIFWPHMERDDDSTHDSTHESPPSPPPTD